MAFFGELFKNSTRKIGNLLEQYSCWIKNNSKNIKVESIEAEIVLFHWLVEERIFKSACKLEELLNRDSKFKLQLFTNSLEISFNRLFSEKDLMITNHHNKWLDSVADYEEKLNYKIKGWNQSKDYWIKKYDLTFWQSYIKKLRLNHINNKLEELGVRL